MRKDNVDRLIADYSRRFPPLITPLEASEIARHESVATIYDWSSRGLLNHIKVKRGRRVLLDLVGFIHFLAGEEHQPNH